MKTLNITTGLHLKITNFYNLIDSYIQFVQKTERIESNAALNVLYFKCSENWLKKNFSNALKNVNKIDLRNDYSQ